MDSGNELNFLKSSIISGMMAIAKVIQPEKAQAQTRKKTG
jgi:hypothetical protein